MSVGHQDNSPSTPLIQTNAPAPLLPPPPPPPRQFPPGQFPLPSGKSRQWLRLRVRRSQPGTHLQHSGNVNRWLILISLCMNMFVNHAETQIKLLNFHFFFIPKRVSECTKANHIYSGPLGHKPLINGVGWELSGEWGGGDCPRWVLFGGGRGRRLSALGAYSS